MVRQSMASTICRKKWERQETHEKRTELIILVIAACSQIIANALIQICNALCNSILQGEQ